MDYRSVQGIDMGILADGTPFLSGRGLAAMAGVAPGVIHTWAPSYDPHATSGRDLILREFLRAQDYHEPELFIRTEVAGRKVNAFPDKVCMAVMEYYAFESRNKSTTAMKNYRRLARGGMRVFIYTALGYGADGVPVKWQQFHDRVKLNQAPIGYFTVFTELAGFMLEAIRNGMFIDSQTVPDVSVGRIWSSHWQDNGLHHRFGDCLDNAPHNYPEYFPQAAANPVPIKAYPEEALGEFRRWLREVYLPTKLPKYLKEKVKKGHVERSTADRLIEVTNHPALPDS